MTHAITIGGLLLFVGAVLGFFAFAGGVLSIMAAGMSDAPTESDGKGGCITTILGAALLVGCILALVL